MEKKRKYEEMTDQEILEMLARIFEVPVTRKEDLERYYYSEGD